MLRFRGVCRPQTRSLDLEEQAILVYYIIPYIITIIIINNINIIITIIIIIIIIILFIWGSRRAPSRPSVRRVQSAGCRRIIIISIMNILNHI